MTNAEKRAQIKAAIEVVREQLNNGQVFDPKTLINLLGASLEQIREFECLVTNLNNHFNN
jgi:hypothetical protein